MAMSNTENKVKVYETCKVGSIKSIILSITHISYPWNNVENKS